MITVDSRKEKIKKYAAEIGFGRIGFSPANACLGERGRLAAWLGKKYHGEMSWIEKSSDVRIDPLKLLPDVKTVISVAVDYYNREEFPKNCEKGKISRYAWGNDYHSVVSEHLEKLFAYIKTLIPSVNGKICVDSGPLLEKFWAERSGIGWRGKHSIIITEELGSWIFLGEILLDEEFGYDSPQADRCGSCTLCIEACPTHAIVEPYILDARKCISYLTIEYEGKYTDEITKEREGWLYGCDICQEVCPWNRGNAKQTAFSDFYARKKIIAPDLKSVGMMSEEDFAEIFRNNPVKRAGLQSLRRNAAILEENNFKNKGK